MQTQANLNKNANKNNPCLFPTLSPVFYKANMTNTGSLRQSIGEEEIPEKSGFTFKKRHQSMMNGSYSSIFNTMDPNTSQFKTNNM